MLRYIPFDDIMQAPLSSQDFAKLCGVGVRTITNLRQDGVLDLHYVDLQDGRHTKMYVVGEALPSYMDHLRKRAAGRDAKREGKQDDLQSQKLKADIALKESQTELHKLKSDIMQGKYVSAEELTLDYRRFFVELKKFVMNIPARVTGQFGGQLDPTEARRLEKELSIDMADMLTRFVEAAKDAGVIEEIDGGDIDESGKD